MARRPQIDIVRYGTSHGSGQSYSHGGIALGKFHEPYFNLKSSKCPCTLTHEGPYVTNRTSAAQVTQMYTSIPHTHTSTPTPTLTQPHPHPHSYRHTDHSRSAMPKAVIRPLRRTFLRAKRACCLSCLETTALQNRGRTRGEGAFVGVSQ